MTQSSVHDNKSCVSNCLQNHNDTENCEARCHQLHCMTESVPAAFTVVMLSTYLMFVVAAYEWRRRKQQVPLFNRLYFLSIICCFASSVTAFFFMTTDQLNCKALFAVSTAFYALSNLLVCFVIWKRQSHLYTDPLLHPSVGAFGRVLNLSVIAGLYACFLSGVAIFLFSFYLNGFEQKCHLQRIKNFMSKHFTIFGILTQLLDALFGLLLFGLTISPLVNIQSLSTCKSGCRTCDSQVENQINNDIINLVRRLALCAGVCVITTIVFRILLILSLNGSICLHWTVVCNCQLLIVNAALVCSHFNGLDRLLLAKHCSWRSSKTVATGASLTEYGFNEVHWKVVLSTFSLRVIAKK